MRKGLWNQEQEKDEKEVLVEYPRPQMRRMSYLNLNGYWRYAIRKDDRVPKIFDGQILVPYSPETKLSEVERVLQPDERLWYERELEIPEGFYMGGKLLLHFGAVDQVCEVFINDVSVTKHEGGYTSFCVDITPFLQEENKITVCVQDFSDTSYYGRGKQTLKPREIWYAATSGIWQTVWLENVPSTYIERIWFTPKYDESMVEVLIDASQDLPCRLSYDHGEQKGIAVEGIANHAFHFYIDNFHAWSPEDPFLYPVTITMGADRVTSYFGMRKFSIEEHQGVKRLCLNNKPYIHKGILDQGYYPDGSYTPKDEEVMYQDIDQMKAMGFNTIRKHVKIEPMTWYHHCDVNGILVWQDMVNGGTMYNDFLVKHPLITGLHAKDSRYKRFFRKSEESRKQYLEETKETLYQLYNAVCIAMWVPFNEGWGQFDSTDVMDRILKLDSTRTIDPASGWSDQKSGELVSEHVYFKKYKFKKDRHHRAVALSEFGGFQLSIEGHHGIEAEYGYKHLDTQEEFEEAYRKMMEEEIAPAVKSGLTAFIYTQFTDVEGERNGLVTFDRKIEKISRESLKKIHDAIEI